MEKEGLSAVASLVENLDQRLLVVLRDGRQYIGVLRSFDQFSNIVLEQCVERVVVEAVGQTSMRVLIILVDLVVVLVDT
jgi:U6 snRNA-associated Sm-like protein LSm1